VHKLSGSDEMSQNDALNESLFHTVSLIIILLPFTDFMDHTAKSGALGPGDVLPVPFGVCFGDDLLARCPRRQPEDRADDRGGCRSASCSAVCRLFGTMLPFLCSDLIFSGTGDMLQCGEGGVGWLLEKRY